METKSVSHCPSEADLTYYYDSRRGGFPATAETASLDAHVSSCPSCQAKLAAYARLDALLSDVLSAPPGLADRIKKTCHRVAEDDRVVGVSPDVLGVRSPWWRTAMRHASLWLVALGVAGAGIWYGLSGEEGSSPVQVAAGARSSGSVSAAVSAVPSARESGVRAASSRPVSGLELARRAPVSVSSGRERVAIPRAVVSSGDLVPVGIGARRSSRQALAIAPKYLGEAVRHVWMADDLGQTQATIRDTLAGLPGVSVSYAGEKEGRLIAHIDGLDDRSLQRVVERLEGKDWALVSPMLPQPGQSQRVSFNGHPVSYTVWVIQKEK